MKHCDALPVIIQGGMGVGVSGWRLARAVSRLGQLGVVSGTAIDVVLARRLQLGDPGGELRRAASAFPIAGVAERVLKRYFIAGGKPADAPFRNVPLLRDQPDRDAIELIMLANFVEVWLAREGHDGPVGVNYLEKVQVPTLASLYGAMLAGVRCVLMGAGIPRAIPEALDRLARGEAIELKLDVKDAGGDAQHVTRFDPSDYWDGPAPALDRPAFLAVVSSATLAGMLARKATGKVDGFIVEGFSAGGHNAPPRGPMQLTQRGEPLYGPRDQPDLEAFRALGVPFWLAGSYGQPGRLEEALQAGASGVQVGTAFAFCEESGLEPAYKQRVIDLCRSGEAEVFTDPLASPTGFPFKVLQLEGTVSEEGLYAQRERVCDIGYLRQAYEKEDGTVGWRCAAEPVKAFVAKGGEASETAGRKCVCNALFVNIGLGQSRPHGHAELPLITCGDDVRGILRFVPTGAKSYSARDVIDGMLGTAAATQK